MGHRPKLRERTDRPGSYFVKIDRKRIDLGRDRQEAERQFHAIMAARLDPKAPVRIAPQITIAELFDQFLIVNGPRWSDGNRSFHDIYLSKFAAFAGANSAASKIIPFDVEQWVIREGWTNANTIANAKRVVKSAFRFGTEMGLIPTNPVAAVKRPTPTRREFVLSPDQQAAFMAAVADIPALDRLCRVMLLSGARPQEARLATTKHFVKADRCWYWPAGSAPKGESERRIYLAGEALAIVTKANREHPEGPVLRDPDGRPWSKDAIARMIRRIADQLGLPEMVAYTLRHAFATNALANGVDPERLRILLGHRDVSMIVRYYSHLNERRDEMRRAADQAVSGRSVSAGRRRR